MPSIIRARRVACSPAAFTTSRARSAMGSGPPTRSSMPSAVARPPSIGAWKAKTVPWCSASPCRASMKAWLSTMPVEGECSAAVQCSAGSIASASSRESSRRSPTPFAAARARMPSSRPASSSVVATISLPQLLCGTPRSRQKA
jgi:hypothetical protein